MKLDLSGRHALVCGGSEGIGRAAAIELAQLGADVTLLARRADALQSAVAVLPNNGSQRHGHVLADVARTDALRDAIAEFRQMVRAFSSAILWPPSKPALSGSACPMAESFTDTSAERVSPRSAHFEDVYAAAA